MGISFNKNTDFELSAYSDSVWSGCAETMRSTWGFSMYLGSNIISWSSKKQSTISKNSTEAEYRSLSETASEITWMCMILKEIEIPLPSTPVLLCDNLSAVMLTANHSFHSKTKHFMRDHHYVRERVALKTLEVHHQHIADRRHLYKESSSRAISTHPRQTRRSTSPHAKFEGG